MLHVVTGLLLAAAPLSAQDSTVVVDSNVAIPMRDGVVLRADVYHAADATRHPVLVYRTPYGKHVAGAAQVTARKAVQRGYVVVMQDVRGRYASAGDFLPYQQEGADGYDTIEWAAQQTWSNGSVGTFGLSYPGAVQWLAAVESPPHLKAMVPAMTFASPMQFWYSNGVWDLSWLSWIWQNIAPDRWHRLGMPAGAPWDSVKRDMRTAIPLSAAPGLDRIAPWYYEWLHHPAYDPWWSWADLTHRYARTSAAVLNLSAWYDDAYGPHGAINNFTGLVTARGKDQATALIMGPWAHGVPRMGRTMVGEREYGAAGGIDYDETVLRWMDRYVRGIDNGVDREKPVRVFVLGTNRWIVADTWPVPGIRAETLWMHGRELTRAAASAADTVRISSDPARPVENQYEGRPGAHDYRAIVPQASVAVFETAPFDEDVSIVGAMDAHVSIAVDAPDVDIWVKVFDVAPDGTAYNLMSPGLDVLRASYRDKGKRETLRSRRIYDLSLPDLFTANTFLRGHRLRVAIMPSWFPEFSRNPQTGDLEASSIRSRPANVTIHMGAGFPSFLVLPVLPRSAMLFAEP
ncbi:MAG TPA: CocE/NonD family hydrolase [Gemmatimonadaceae bacterium]|nr:CocE/NonD family hydrolase [Gemmatimonadaceae bacterium]